MRNPWLVGLALVAVGCGGGGKPCVDDQGCPASEVCGPAGSCVPGQRDGGATGGGAGGGATGGGAGGGATGGGSGGGAMGGGSGGGAMGGGSGGGAMGGGAGGGGTPTCAPACPDWQECVGTSCVDRYSAIALTAPTRTRRQFFVLAELQLAPGRMPVASPPLTITATRDAVPQAANLLTVDAGLFFSNTIQPNPEGTWQFTVEWPDAGLSAMATTIVDTTPPDFTVSIDPPPARIVDGGLDQRDPQSPNAHRRDESLTVRLAWTASDVDPASARLQLGDRAFEADAGVAFDGGFTFVAPLWEPTFDSFRGNLPVFASLSDDLGSHLDRDAGTVPLTRLRWRYAVTGLSPGTGPAPVVLDSTGGAFVATVAPSVVALRSDGTLRWERTTAAGVRSMALGSVPSSDGPLLYTNEIGASDMVTGEAFPVTRPTAAVRTWATTAARPSSVGPVVVSDEAGNNEGAYLAFADGATSKAALLWGSVVGTTQSTTRVPPATVSPVATLKQLIANGRSVYALADNRVFGFGTVANLGFPEELTSGYPLIASSFTSFMNRTAINGTGELVGFGLSGGLFKAWKTAYPTPPAAVNPTSVDFADGPLVSGNTVWYLRSDFISGGTRIRVCHTIIGGTPTCSSDNTESLNAAVLGEGGRLYTTGQRIPAGDRVVQERDATTLAVRWEGPGFAFGPTLVCGPGGKTGALYGIQTPNTIHSIIVDAKGLDATADWPMAAHDPQGSLDKSRSLAKFQCP